MDAVLDAQLIRMGLLPVVAEGPLGQERVVHLGGVECRLWCGPAPLGRRLDALAALGRAVAGASCVIDGRVLVALVHGPQATASPAAMQRLLDRLFDDRAVAALREAGDA